jgi:predicted DNA-binding transcriptional regulator AlpA
MSKSKAKSTVRHDRRVAAVTSRPIALAEDLDLVTCEEACRILGGNVAPIDKSTLYRGMHSGRFPRGIKISPNVVRWSRAELEAALRTLMERRVA